jgi:hypothetical protein
MRTSQFYSLNALQNARLRLTRRIQSYHATKLLPEVKLTMFNDRINL